MGTVLLLLLLDTNDDDDGGGGGGGDHPGDSDRASERVQVSQQLPVAYRQSASFDSRGIKKKSWLRAHLSSSASAMARSRPLRLSL